MTAIWLALRADLRAVAAPAQPRLAARAASAASCFASAAGARRTDTAYPRLLAGPTPRRWTSSRRAPGSTALLPGAGEAAADRRHGHRRALPGGPAPGDPPRLGPPGERHGEPQQWRARRFRGQGEGARPARCSIPGTPGRAVIDPRLAALEHLAPGGTLRLLGVPNAPGTSNPEACARPVPVSFLVTAVVAFDNQVVPLPGGSNSNSGAAPTALLSCSPWRARRRRWLRQ